MQLDISLEAQTEGAIGQKAELSSIREKNFFALKVKYEISIALLAS